MASGSCPARASVTRTDSRGRLIAVSAHQLASARPFFCVLTRLLFRLGRQGSSPLGAVSLGSGGLSGTGLLGHGCISPGIGWCFNVIDRVSHLYYPDSTPRSIRENGKSGKDFLGIPVRCSSGSDPIPLWERGLARFGVARRGERVDMAVSRVSRGEGDRLFGFCRLCQSV